MMRVLIVDDHAVVREGIKRIVAGIEDQIDVGEAADAAEACRRVREQQWDLVLLDISLPGRTGLDLLSQLRREYPQLPVLVLSMYPEDQYAARVLRAGASGYLTKESAPELLATAIEQVTAGGRYVSPGLAVHLANRLDERWEQPAHESLSNREFSVLRLLAQGRQASEIAQALSLSVKTVSTYRSRVLKKLGLRTTAELMAYAIREGLAD
jgi:DNA-binding NarL/FixJ family response regulator